LQLLDDLLVSLEIFGSFKVGGPYQPLDEHDAGSWAQQFKDGEVALYRRMRTTLLRKNLHHNVRQSWQPKDSGHLRRHDAALPECPVMRCLIENCRKTRGSPG